MANAYAGRVVVPLRPGSDGDIMHKPVGLTHSKVDPPILYLEKLGDQWMKARGEARPGVHYILERLPAGYTLYQRPRGKNPSTVDKYLFGHPEHRPFDSPNRFFPHFVHLMENDGSSIGCPCTVCNAKGGVLPKMERTGSSQSKSSSRSSSSETSSRKSSPMPTEVAPAPIPRARVAPQVKGRPKMVLTGMDTSRVDEEGTPDVYRNLIDKLKRHGTLDEAIMEPMSMDWRSEQAILPGVLKKLEQEPQWIPRAGDIVIYVRELPDGLEITQHPSTRRYEYFDPETRMYLGAPSWEAGMVGQTPAEDTVLNDAIQGEKESNVSLSGVRVEPLPSPNDVDKSLSKRYKYVPVHHTRPFFLWKDYLGNISEDDWQPTIKNALTIMSTMSLMGKHRFRGQWPDAMIYSHGIYIGSEILAIGDTVRLLPKSGESTCTDILVIKSIRLKLSNLDKASINDYDEGRPYNSEVWIFGAAYTTDASRSSKEWLSAENTETPKSAGDYGNWHPLHPPNKELAVPFSRILGRLYERDALHLWLSLPPDIDQGREGLLEARTFARANDRRITSSFGATWFWGDSRSEALDLQTVNGLEVGRYDTERDPKDWRRKIKVMEGVSSKQKSLGTKLASGSNQNLRVFMAPATATLPMRPQDTVIKSVEGSGSSSTGEGSMSGQKRAHVIDLGDDDEEEIRQQTRIVDEQPIASQKKAKVMVVID